MFLKRTLVGLFCLVAFATQSVRAGYNVQVKISDHFYEHTQVFVNLHEDARNASFLIADSMILWVIDGEFDTLDFDPSIPLVLRVDGSLGPQDILVNGIETNQNVVVELRGGPGDDRLEVRMPLGIRPVPFSEGVEAGALILGGTGNDTLIGGPGQDYMRGGFDNDSIIGNQGDDTLDGQAGNDFVFGGDGADVVIGGDGNDTLMGSDAIGHNGLHPIGTLDVEVDVLEGGPGQDYFVERYYRYEGRIFKRKNYIDSDMVLDYQPGDTLGEAEVPAVSITDVFR